MKKLFSIFGCLLLSASMVTQAQLLDALNDSSEGGYVFNDNGQISGRNNAPMTTYTATWSTDFRKSESQEVSGTKQRWYVSTSQNLVTTGSLGFPVIQISFCITNGSAYNYGAISGPPTGDYTISTATTLSNTSTNRYICSSGYSGGQQASGIMTNNTTMLWLSQGTVKVARGTGGYPYIYTSSTKTKTNNSGTAKTNDFKMGTALPSYSLTVSSNNSSYGKVGLEDTNVGESGTRGTWYTTQTGQSSISVTAYRGDQIRISATPETGYTFTKWSDNVTTNPRTVTISAAATYTAQFAAASSPGTITGAVNNAAYGSVDVDPSGEQDPGTQVTLTATANPGYVFDHWSEDNSDVNPRTVAVNGNATYTAVFLPLYTISVATADETKGAVSGGGTVVSGENVTIQATPFKGYVFSQWQDGNTDNPRTVSATANRTYTATFTTSPIIETHAIGVAMADFRTSSPYIYQLQVYINNPANLCFTINVDQNSSTTLLSQGFTRYQHKLYTYNALPTGPGGAINGTVQCNTTVTGTVKNIYDGYYEGDFYVTGTGSYAHTYHVHLYYMDPTESNRTLVSVDNTATSSAYGHDFGSASTSVSSGRTKLTLSGSVGSSSYTWSGNLWFPGVGATNYVPTGIYSYNAASGANNVSSGYLYVSDGNYYSYFSCSGASYKWYPMAGRVAVINPNHTSTPLYVETYFCSSKFADIAVTFQHQAYYGTEPDLCKVTMGTPSNGTNTMTSVEGHGYTYGGIEIDQTGDYYYAGTNLTLTATPDAAYEFKQWSDGNTDNPRYVTVEEAATYTAEFRIPVTTYTLGAWNANGGTITVAGTAAGSYEEGTSLTAPTVTKTGYTFSKWRDVTNGVDFNGSMPANDVTYTAQWTPNEYTINLDNQSATTGGTSSQTVDYGTALPDITVPTKTGNAFGGYFTETNGGGTMLIGTDGKWVKNVSGYTDASGNLIHADNFDLYAKWTELVSFTIASYSNGTVTVTPNDGSDAFTTGSRDLAVGTMVSFSAVASTNYHISTVNLNINGSDNSFSTTSAYTLKTGDGTVTLTANFLPDTYAITYNAGANGTGTIDAGEKTYNVPLTLSSSTFTREGYTQTGWSTEDGGSKAYDLGDTYTDNTAVTLYPYWEVNSYTLTWVTDGDALTGTYTSGSTAYGAPIAQPNTPTKTGYTFDAWSPTPAANMPATTTTYTATWEAIEYSITFNTNGGNPVGNLIYTIEDDDIELWTAEDATKDGFTFAGWYANEELTGSPVTTIAQGSYGNKEFWAKWTENITYYTLNISAGTNGSVNTAVNGQKEAGTKVTIEATPKNSFYAFTRWSDDNTENPREITMNSDVTLTASFAIADPMPLNDNEGDAYYTAYDALSGNTGVNVQLMRTMKADTWSTICLPFDFELEDSEYEGKFYQFMGASGDYASGLNLYFSPTGRVEANVPYLFRSSSEYGNPVFSNATLHVRSAQSAGEITYGNVRFQGTAAPEMLNDAGGHTILGLIDNKVYYPNLTSGTLIRAFRAYFVVGGLPAGVQPRVRIVVSDNNATAIDVIETDGADGMSAPEVRKYMENGILIIERNGVKYNAEGAVVR